MNIPDWKTRKKSKDTSYYQCYKSQKNPSKKKKKPKSTLGTNKIRPIHIIHNHGLNESAIWHDSRNKILEPTMIRKSFSPKESKTSNNVFIWNTKQLYIGTSLIPTKVHRTWRFQWTSIVVCSSRYYSTCEVLIDNQKLSLRLYLMFLKCWSENTTKKHMLLSCTSF